MNISNTIAWVFVMQLTALVSFLLGYSVVIYKKKITLGAWEFFFAACLLHVVLWFVHFGTQMQLVFTSGGFASMWADISKEHQAAVASILVAVGYIFCLITAALAVLEVGTFVEKHNETESS